MVAVAYEKLFQASIRSNLILALKGLHHPLMADIFLVVLYSFITKASRREYFMCHLYLGVKRSLLGMGKFSTLLRRLFTIKMLWALNGDVILSAQGKAWNRAS